MGRPSVYSDELADLICDKIANNSFGVHQICREEGMPSPSTVFKWLSEKPYFSDKYACARELQAELLADEIIDIADDTSNDTLIHEKTGAEYANSEWINRSRLKVDARKWKASKLAPKKYGDKLEHSIDPDGVITEIIRTVISKKI